jgi:uncharacterized protein YjaZ
MTQFHIFILERSEWADAEKNGLLRQTLREKISSAAHRANKFLNLDDQVNIVVNLNEYGSGLIPETGTGGRTHDTGFVEYFIDPRLPRGAEYILRDDVNATVFHELNHAARWTALPEIDDRLIADAIFEGLATAFARDFGDSKSDGKLWGNYHDESENTLQNWAEELIAAGSDWTKRDELFFQNTDGRRWIGYKTGTWIVDRAAKNSSKSIPELSTLSVEEIMRFAGLTYSEHE